MEMIKSHLELNKDKVLFSIKTIKTPPPTIIIKIIPILKKLTKL
jgi:hypothetical protein